jgi:hypothetical protein
MEILWTSAIGGKIKFFFWVLGIRGSGPAFDVHFLFRQWVDSKSTFAIDCDAFTRFVL